MKNIKFFSILFILMMASQLSFAQSAENNGRDNGVAPGPVVEEPVTPAAAATTEDDRDIPGDQREASLDYFYPMDIDIINEDLSNSIHPAELVERINDLTDLVKSMKADYEELKLENNVIRESFSNCCSAAELRLSAKDAYLLQNAPNPFLKSSEISYFVPTGLTSVQLEIRDFKGVLLKAIPINESGYGKVNVDAASASLTSGSYIYSLSIGGQMVDSKVMVKVDKN